MSDKPWDGVTERRKDTVEGGTLQARLDALNHNVERLTNVVDENTKALSRLAVLEVSHNNSEAAINRAFVEIEKMQGLLEKHVEANATDHEGYSKWIWMAAGFGMAISVMWTVVGYRMNAMIDDQVKAVAEMRLHINEDKVTTTDHVRAAVAK